LSFRFRFCFSGHRHGIGATFLRNRRKLEESNREDFGVILAATLTLLGLIGFLLIILPLVVSISFMLIADIDSPRGGFIRVNPQNLTSLSDSLSAQ
jgi:hypothetical protein